MVSLGKLNRISYELDFGAASGMAFGTMPFVFYLTLLFFSLNRRSFFISIALKFLTFISGCYI
jgi:hypothetical protein